MPAIVKKESIFTAARPEPRPDLIRPGSPAYRVLSHPVSAIYSVPAFMAPLLSPETAESTARIDAALKPGADMWVLARRVRDTVEMVFGPLFAGEEADHVAYAVRELHRSIDGTLPDGTTYHAWARAVWSWNWAAIASALMSTYESLCGFPDIEFRDQTYLGLVELGRRFGVLGMPASYPEFQALWPAERARFAEPTTEAFRRMLQYTTPSGFPPPSHLAWLPLKVWIVLAMPLRHLLKVSIAASVPAEFLTESRVITRTTTSSVSVHRLFWRIVPRRIAEMFGRSMFSVHRRFGSPVWRTRFSESALAKRRETGLGQGD